MIQQLDAGKDVKDIDIKLHLTTLKPLHAQWMVDFYNHMTTPKGVDVIMSGWKKAGILAAIEKGALTISGSLDPFNDLDPRVDFVSVDANMESLCIVENAVLEANCNRRNGVAMNEENEDEVDDEEWYLRDEPRNAFDLYDDEEDDDDENNDSVDSTNENDS